MLVVCLLVCLLCFVLFCCVVVLMCFVLLCVDELSCLVVCCFVLYVWLCSVSFELCHL